LFWAADGEEWTDEGGPLAGKVVIDVKVDITEECNVLGVDAGDCEEELRLLTAAVLKLREREQN